MDDKRTNILFLALFTLFPLPGYRRVLQACRRDVRLVFGFGVPAYVHCSGNQTYLFFHSLPLYIFPRSRVLLAACMSFQDRARLPA